ncbi:serine-type D-Ala-D-Ala carboxypeptidase [Calothrix parasitica NIES-267]|uniref:Serine-type D-Ala-D-Ala carboxypeptidase n=1 Tax=Calothrix parasitica NIES-267 TaxID=1973488 RepID=A0A1Z4LR95_9CYAN|nr:serine-type D-Ala-D-Ala carboxypeptidase [Calothrix parasitica NIES-267]
MKNHALQTQLNQSLRFTSSLGVNVAINDEKHGFWLGSAGFSDINAGNNLENNQSFYIYSITKTFVSVCLLKLIENRLLNLEDTISKWLPKISFPNSVTLRRLLNHTSGVPDYTSLKEYLPSVRENPSIPWTHKKVIELTCSGNLDFEPGEGFYYSNTGYMLLYKVIEAVTKKSFAEVLQKEIFDKLDFKNTYVAHQVDTKNILTPGYCRFLNSEIKIENVIPRYHPDWCATGLIVSNVEEVVKFFDAVFSGKLLNNQSLKEMQTLVDIGVRQRWYRKACYGLGIMADPESKYGIKYGHGGDGPGYNTFAMHLPDFCGRKLSLAIFCNTSMMEHPYGMISDLLRVLETV